MKAAKETKFGTKVA